MADGYLAATAGLLADVISSLRDDAYALQQLSNRIADYDNKGQLKYNDIELISRAEQLQALFKFLDI